MIVLAEMPWAGEPMGGFDSHREGDNTKPPKRDEPRQDLLGALAMSNINIGRYDGSTITGDDGTERPLTEVYQGWVEGIADDGSRWIIYLDGDGRPELYWPQREESGAVVGEPIHIAA